MRKASRYDYEMIRAEFAADDAVEPPSRLVRFLRYLAFLFPIRVIYGEDFTPYLLRVYLVSARFFPGIYLHFFCRGDSAAEYHNHPWKWALSWILTHGYIEDRFADGAGHTYLRSAGNVALIRRDTWHKVSLYARGAGGPCKRPWTLFISGPRVKKPYAEAWGFIDAEYGTYRPWTKLAPRVDDYLELRVDYDPDPTDRFDCEEIATARFERKQDG